MVTINIQKKDLWLFSAIMVFLVGVGFVVAYNSGGPASTIGHSADELDGVCKSDGTNCLSTTIDINDCYESTQDPSYTHVNQCDIVNNYVVVSVMNSGYGVANFKCCKLIN